MQKPPSPPEGKVPFYRVVYKGRQLQSIWQGAVGASLLVGLVIFPLVGMYSHDMLNSPLLPSLHKQGGMSCVFILTPHPHTHSPHRAETPLHGTYFALHVTRANAGDGAGASRGAPQGEGGGSQASGQVSRRYPPYANAGVHDKVQHASCNWQGGECSLRFLFCV